MKKLLALAIVFSLFYGIKNETSLAWFWSKEFQSTVNTCDKMNKCGQYKDINCAIGEGIEILKAKLDNNVYFRKAGQNCKYDLRIWNDLNLKSFYFSMGTDLQSANEVLKFFRGYHL